MTDVVCCDIIIAEIKESGVRMMTEHGAEIIRDAMRAISEQCTGTGSCKNCPFSYYCQCMDSLAECRPDMWFRKMD